MPCRVRAPHLGASRKRNWLVSHPLHGVADHFHLIPLPYVGYIADDRLSARMDVYVLHCDLLLALTAVPVERVQQDCITGKLVRLVQILAAPVQRKRPV